MPSERATRKMIRMIEDHFKTLSPAEREEYLKQIDEIRVEEDQLEVEEYLREIDERVARGELKK